MLNALAFLCADQMPPTHQETERTDELRGLESKREITFRGWILFVLILLSALGFISKLLR